MLVIATLLATLSSTVRSRAALELENLALRHQIGVLQRSARKRPKLTPVDRLVWAWLSHIWSDWRSALAIVSTRDRPGLAPQGLWSVCRACSITWRCKSS